jgi:hypothetical protein
VKKSFAIGRVQSVAALGELLVRPWFRWDGPPGRRQSHKNDTMGVGLAPNCPDRSRCGTSRSGTRHGGDTDRQTASHAALQKPSVLRRKEKELRRNDWVGAVQPRSRWQRILGLTASARDSAPHPLRSARDEFQPSKKPDGIRTTLLTTLIGVKRQVRRGLGPSPCSQQADGPIARISLSESQGPHR